MTNQWLSTTKAAKNFGISPDTLKRWGRPKTGYLREGVHCKRGIKVSHPHDWNINLCSAELQSQGFHLLIAMIKYHKTTLTLAQ